MLKTHSYPLYDHLLVIGATSELFQLVLSRILPYVGKLTCIGRNLDGLKNLKEEYPNHLEILQADLSKKEDLALIDALIQKTSFDGLLQLQGYGYYGKYDEIEFIEHERIIQLNLLSLMEICHSFLKYQKSSDKKKLILHVASLAGIIHPPYIASYAAAKAALIHLTKTLQIENLDYFTFEVLCPGAFGKHFSYIASKGSYKNPDTYKRYTDQVVEALFAMIAHKKHRMYCTILDWLKGKIYFFSPLRWIKKGFDKRFSRK